MLGFRCLFLDNENRTTNTENRTTKNKNKQLTNNKQKNVQKTKCSNACHQYVGRM